MAEGVATAITTALTFVVMAIVRRWYSVTDIGDGPSFEELKPVYAKWTNWGAAAWLLLLVACVTGLGLAFRRLALPSVVRDAAGNIVEMHPSDAADWLAAGLPGFAASTMLLSAAYRVLLGERFALWRRYELLSEGYDSWRFLATMNFFFALGGAALLLGPSDWSIRIHPTAIAFDPVLSFSETTRPDDDIISIRYAETFIAPNGREVDQYRAEVEYTDGFVWKTKHCLADADPEELRDVIDRIADRSGVAAVKVNAVD